MNPNELFCGVECYHSSNILDALYVINHPGNELNDYYFNVVDKSVYLYGKEIDIPNTITPIWLQSAKLCIAERLVLHLYPIGKSPEIIDTYSDFLKSRCEMILLIYDCYYAEIYCKNILWLNTIFDTLQKDPQVSVHKKFESTDTRTTMYV